MDELTALASRLDRVESELAIRRLAHDYCGGADRRDERRWLGAWTSDAVWEASTERAMTGHAEIFAGVQMQWKHFRQMQHSTVNHSVDLDPDDPDRASGRADVVVHVQLPDGRWVTGGGTYVDDYRREGPSWRIARRSVTNAFDLAPLAPSPGPYVTGET